MKLFIAATAVALTATAAMADNSTRYNDMRLNTAQTADKVFSDQVQPTDIDGAQRGRDQLITMNPTPTKPDVAYSTRSEIRSPGEGYIYGGYGPGNDSR